MKSLLLMLTACTHTPYAPPPGSFSASVDRLLAPVAMYADACPPWFAAWTRCVLVGGGR